MRKPIRLTLMAIVLAAVSLAIAACGDDEDDESAATTGETTAEMLMLTGEETILALDSGTAKVLEDNEVTVEPVDPATAGGDGIAFPITGGEVEAETLLGTIDHSGGLEFSAGGTEVELTDFVVDTAAGTLTATTADGAQLPTLDLDLGGLEQTTEGDVIVASGITATLSGDAAQALNDAFGVNVFEEGLRIGDVTVRASQ
jgi:hypothetical protein